MRVDVTQEDIDAGVPRDPFCCALARAVERAAGERLRVGTHAVYRDPGVPVPATSAAVVYLCRLPDEARTFQVAFDYKRPVQPFSFELELP